MTIDDVKLSEEGRFLPWGKVAAEKLQKVEDWIAAGGGNPNMVQTITGTLADPWGDLDHQELFDALSHNNASCRLAVDLTEIAMGSLTTLLFAEEDKTSPDAYSSGASITSSEVYRCYQARWSYIDGDLCAFTAVLSGVYQDLSSYASAIPTTLTIIWHPLPESE